MKQTMIKKIVLLVYIFASVSVFAEDGFEETNVEGAKISDNVKFGFYLKIAPEFNTNIKKSDPRSYSITSEDVKTDQKELSDLILHINPGIKFNMEDRSKRLAVSTLFDYGRYFGIEEEETKDNSSHTSN